MEMNDNSQIWTNILRKIKIELTSVSYETWFKDTKLYELKNGIAKIIVPYAMHKDHLKDHYTDLIKSKFIEEIGDNIELEFLIEEDLEENNINVLEDNNLINNNTYEEDISFNFESHLNKKYTFENFVVGNSNKFAQMSALAVAENPGSIYNPLFIYGNSGLGKTHLMHAIGNYIEKNSNKKVLYITSETFCNDFIDMTKKENNKSDFDNIAYFKKKYRGIDVLIVDDIQFLAKRTESQKEFFHTFQNLYEDEKQIIISSDRSPNDLKLLEDRLRTRFSWGLSVNIYPPDFELKLEILKRKIKGEAIKKEVPENVLEYIASNAGTDIRSLIGSLTRLLAYSTMMGRDIDLTLAIEALKDFLNSGYSEKNDVSKIVKNYSNNDEIFKYFIEHNFNERKNENVLIDWENVKLNWKYGN